MANIDVARGKLRSEVGSRRPIPGEKAKVLVVEDQPDLLELIGEQLEALGFEVLAAASGKSACDYLERNLDLEILFSDVVLPGGMSGHAVSSRAKDLIPNIRVLLTSGYGQVGVTAARLSGLRVLPKPFTFAELREALTQTLADEYG